MGPPELPGGNADLVVLDECHTRRLQWGRRNYPAETTVSWVTPGPMTMMLQWGRRNYPAETSEGAPTVASFSICFNGAAGITRRKQG